MPFKIIRNDIVKMECDAIVNTANEDPVCGTGCDRAIYRAAGREELLEIRTGVNVVTCEDPLCAVAIGTGRYAELKLN